MNNCTKWRDIYFSAVELKFLFLAINREFFTMSLSSGFYLVVCTRGPYENVSYRMSMSHQSFENC